MADQSNILKEYLVALGFVVDEGGAGKVDGVLTKMDKRVTGLAKGIFGVAAATKAMVTVFAYQMEKLYYSSQRAQASAGNIQAIDYAFRQLGGSGDAIKGAVEGMASALRQNPGLIAMLENLGVKTQGRDRVQVLNDFITKLRGMPPYIAAQYAKMFGIDEGMLFTLTQNLEKFNQAQADRKEMAASMGVDMDEAARAGQKYAETLRELYERVGLLKDAISMKLLPGFQETASVVREVLIDLTRLVNTFKDWQDFAERFREGWTGNMKGGGVQLSDDAKTRLKEMGITPQEPAKPKSYWESVKESVYGLWSKKPLPTTPPAATPPKTTAPSSGASMEERQAYLASLEQKYGLPQGWLDRVWKKESNRGDPRYMRSKAGAKGHFQFMDPTAREYGLQDPDNFEQSADAAGRYYRDLLRRYKGDQRKAAAAYNWGMGNVDRQGLGAMPAETRGYVDAIAGPITINQEINVSGVSNPQEAATYAGDATRRANADLVRDLNPKVR